MLFEELAATSAAVSATRSRLAKRALLSDLLRRTPPPTWHRLAVPRR